MTMDRRFSYLNGECRRWLDPEEIELERELDRNSQRPRHEGPLGEESSHGLASVLGGQQPLARLGDFVSQ
jgi:hypothetical protein